MNMATGTISLSFSGNFDKNSFSISDGRTISTDPYSVNIQVKSFVCFVTGTRIRTDRGDVAVEAMRVGDVAITASGQARPVTWIGQRTLRGIDGPVDGVAWPVRVVAGTFGVNRPDRDLFLSPGHAICVDMMGEIFVPVGRLVNGGTIASVPVDEVTYWHIELDSHDVLLSNNLPTESYLDMGNRTWFAGDGDAMVPDDADRSRYARPFVDDGAIVEAVRLRVAARAREMGWTDICDMDLHLVVDGRRVDGDKDHNLARFIFPASAREVRLLSHCFTPAHMVMDGDARALGVCLTGMTLSDGFHAERAVALTEPLFDGQHDLEQDGAWKWRWTRGDLPFDPAIWDGFRSHVILRLDLLPSQGRRWVPPMMVGAMPEGRVVALSR
ncbi:hypothetical protein GL174_04830 [Sphingobium sp. CAP-1]|nr:hypothetical protein GL174_04830 [Sphingobium sp. CAP-1]